MTQKQSQEKFYRFILLILFIALLCSVGSAQKETNPAASFKKCWTFSSDNPLTNVLASDNDLLFTSTLPDTVHALKINSGEPVWKISVGGKIGSMVIGKDFLIVRTERTDAEFGTSLAENANSAAFLISIDPISGIVNWKKSIASGDIISTVLFDGLLVLIEESGVIMLVNSRDGKTIRKIELNHKISAIHHFQHTLVLGTAAKKILIFSISAGKTETEIPVSEIPTALFLTQDRRVIWADGKGFVRSVSPASLKPTWKKRFGGEISSISEAAGAVLISSLDNFIYSISPNSGKLRWKKRMAGRVVTVPLAIDQSVVAVAYGDSSALVLDSETGSIIDLLTLSDATFFFDQPVTAKNSIIFPTSHGLVAYALGVCP